MSNKWLTVYTPYPNPSPSVIQQFWNQLQQLPMAIPGWCCTNILAGYDHGYAVRVSFVCPHGQTLDQEVSMYALESAPDGVSLANAMLQQVRAQCDYGHKHIPPPGQFIYSIAQTEPVAYYTQYNGVIDTSYFKQQYPASYTEMVAQQAKLLESYGQYSGLSGASISSTILQLCPGLRTISRPCPEKGCKALGESALLYNLIQHINDGHQWSREKIAEWLDIIAIDDPSVDLTIKPIKKETKNEQPSISASEIDIAEALGYGTVTLNGKAVSEEYAW